MPIIKCDEVIKVVGVKEKTFRIPLMECVNEELWRKISSLAFNHWYNNIDVFRIRNLEYEEENLWDLCLDITSFKPTKNDLTSLRYLIAGFLAANNIDYSYRRL